MKKLVLPGLLLVLTSCGVVPIPRTVPLNVVSVTLPTTLPPGADLSVTVKYSVDCSKRNERLLLAHRTAAALALEAVGTDDGTSNSCPAAATEKTLTYADSGSVNRSGPFEVIVNGKSWGKVEIR